MFPPLSPGVQGYVSNGRDGGKGQTDGRNMKGKLRQGLETRGPHGRQTTQAYPPGEPVLPLPPLLHQAEIKGQEGDKYQRKTQGARFCQQLQPIAVSINKIGAFKGGRFILGKDIGKSGQSRTQEGKLAKNLQRRGKGIITSSIF